MIVRFLNPTSIFRGKLPRELLTASACAAISIISSFVRRRAAKGRQIRFFEEQKHERETERDLMLPKIIVSPSTQNELTEKRAPAHEAGALPRADYDWKQVFSRRPNQRIMSSPDRTRSKAR